MKRRKFLFLTGAGALGVITPGISSNVFFRDLPANPILVRLLWKFARDVAVGVAVEGISRWLWDDDENENESRSESVCCREITTTRAYLNTKQYSGVPEAPVMTYSAPFIPSSLPNLERPKQYSGIDDYLAFSFAKTNQKTGDVVGTQTAFMLNGPNRKKIAALLPESQLITMLKIAQNLREGGVETKRIQELLLPVADLSQQESLDKRFFTSIHQTAHGYISFDCKIEFDNGMDFAPTNVKSVVTLSPRNIQSEYSDEFAKELTLTLPEIEIEKLVNGL